MQTEEKDVNLNPSDEDTLTPGQDADPGSQPDTGNAPEDEQNENVTEETSDVIVEFDGKEIPDEDEDGVPLDELKTAKPWVKKVRELNKERAKKLKIQEKEIEDLKKKLAEKESIQDQQPNPAPLFEDFDDVDEWVEATRVWAKEEAKVEARKEIEYETKAEKEARIIKERNDARMAKYNSSREALAKTASDIESAEEVVTSILTPEYISTIVDLSKDPAKMLYALGKNPAKAKEYASLGLLNLAHQIAEDEPGVTLKPRRPETLPEDKLEGRAATATGSKKIAEELDRLRSVAGETGDMTPVINFKKKHGIL